MAQVRTLHVSELEGPILVLLSLQATGKVLAWVSGKGLDDSQSWMLGHWQVLGKPRQVD